MAIRVVTVLRQNLCRPIQVLLLLCRVSAAMPGQVNQIRSICECKRTKACPQYLHLMGIGSRHFVRPPGHGRQAERLLAEIRI